MGVKESLVFSDLFICCQSWSFRLPRFIIQTLLLTSNLEKDKGSRCAEDGAQGRQTSSPTLDYTPAEILGSPKYSLNHIYFLLLSKMTRVLNKILFHIYKSHLLCSSEVTCIWTSHSEGCTEATMSAYKVSQTVALQRPPHPWQQSDRRNNRNIIGCHSCLLAVYCSFFFSFCTLYFPYPHPHFCHSGSRPEDDGNGGAVAALAGEPRQKQQQDWAGVYTSLWRAGRGYWTPCPLGIAEDSDTLPF